MQWLTGPSQLWWYVGIDHRSIKRSQLKIMILFYADEHIAGRDGDGDWMLFLFFPARSLSLSLSRSLSLSLPLPLPLSLSLSPRVWALVASYISHYLGCQHHLFFRAQGREANEKQRLRKEVLVD